MIQQRRDSVTPPLSSGLASSDTHFIQSLMKCCVASLSGQSPLRLPTGLRICPSGRDQRPSNLEYPLPLLFFRAQTGHIVSERSQRVGLREVSYLDTIT